MICPDCQAFCNCVDSRNASARIIKKRRYRCSQCGGVYHTVEIFRKDYSELVTYKIQGAKK